MRMRAGIAGLAALIVVSIAGASPVEPVEATWQDAELATAQVTAGSLAAPTRGGSCSVGLLGTSVTFPWAHGVGGTTRTGYVVTVREGGVVQGTMNLAANATSVDGSSLLSSLLFSRTYSVTVEAAAGSWRSAPLTGTFTTTALGLITRCTW